MTRKKETILKIEQQQKCNITKVIYLCGLSKKLSTYVGNATLIQSLAPKHKQSQFYIAKEF